MKKSAVMLSVMCIGLVGWLACDVFAEDELYLCGIVKETNLQAGTVTVDVKSEGCKGVRQFRAPLAHLSGFIVNTEKCFSIDSNHCTRGQIYDIVIDNDLMRDAQTPIGLTGANPRR